MEKTKILKSNFIDKNTLHMIIYGSHTKIAKILNKDRRHQVYLMSWIYSLMIGVLILISFVTLIFPIETLQSRPIIFTMFELVIFAFLSIDYALR
jgi:hypothetical protein